MPLREDHPWNAAARRLLDDVYAFVATGPRSDGDWASDALAVMHRTVRDPRGWAALDWDRDNEVRQTLPAYPFDPPTASEFARRLHPLTLERAVGLLAVMTEEWQSEPAPVRSRPHREVVLTDARTLLARYGPHARFWTNAEAAAGDAGADFVTAGLARTRSHGFATSAYYRGVDIVEDVGLIVVSDDEVGLFWSFGAC
ncbi:hypothetical protein ABZ934_31275 [Streptomyces sp. NPDC046557]|uniref:hypothetical protein n=1 Tax=Streptomyces sp. NPDC046557 TaxID=3155372 RepID=UPI0033D54AC4